MLDEVLLATEGRDVTVLYAHSVRPFDARTLRSVLAAPEVVLVEPWLAGTSAHAVSDALRDVPHRLLALGVRREELRRYGTAEDHVRAHGLDAAGLRASIDGFLGDAVAAERRDSMTERFEDAGAAALRCAPPRARRCRCSSVGRALLL